MLHLLLILQLHVPVTKNFLPGKEPRDTTRNYIVIHNDGAGLNAPSTRYVLRRRGLSYHFFISRNGDIQQWMDLKYVALHAGRSLWNNISNWNDFSIGICLQGTSFLPYTEQQYQALTMLVNYIRIRYPDSREKPILGHSDIAYPAKRKNDPGEHFESWRLYEPFSYNPSR